MTKTCPCANCCWPVELYEFEVPTTPFCDKCADKLQTDPEHKHGDKTEAYSPKTGWKLDLSGGYGQFNDTMDAAHSEVILCHDCCLKLAREFPIFGNRNRGWHLTINDDGSSCCEFSYATDASGCLVLGDGRGGWIAAVAPDGTMLA